MTEFKELQNIIALYFSLFSLFNFLDAKDIRIEVKCLTDWENTFEIEKKFRRKIDNYL